MSENGAHGVLVSARSLYWVKDRDQILLVNRDLRTMQRLQGPEAAVWSWLALGYPYSKILGLFAGLLGLPSPEAAPRLHRLFQRWIEAQILTLRTG